MTEPEAEHLRSRVTSPEPGIVVFRELPHFSIETLDSHTEYAKELGEQFKRWCLVIDLSDVTQRPDAAYRERLKQRMDYLHPEHAAYVQPGNLILRTTLKFILTTFPGKNTVHQKLDQALAALRETLQS